MRFFILCFSNKLKMLYNKPMRPVVLTILDGWGYSTQNVGNAIANARKPNMDFIMANYPGLLLQASGKAVGLTWGETGNSEVGHLTIGAGRIIFQYLSRINRAIETGEFYNNAALLQASEHVKKNGSKLHVTGLLTSGSVHSYLGHIIALIEFAHKNNIPKTYLHLYTDAKDSGLKEGRSLLMKLNEHLVNYPNVKVATIVGRDFSMDRGNNWNLTEQAYNLMVRAIGEAAPDPANKLAEYYAQGLHDNKIPPLLVDPEGIIRDGDALIFFNFREDSIRQTYKCFVDTEFEFFRREPFNNLLTVAMTPYLEDPKLPVVFPAPIVANGLTEVLSNNGKKQLHIAETEKYAHATFFFNGLKSEPYPGESDIIIQSTKKPDDEPEMMANEITDKVIEEIQKDAHDFIIINYANADMLAHSGNLQNTIRGIETIDSCMGRLKEAVFQKDGILIITADHGNAESVTSKGGEEESRHNMSPVPFFIVVKEYERQRSEEEIKIAFSDTKGIIADVAPTILQILGISKPAEMTGESLFKLLI
jgi:2,3-bisphosphoglycerate-independent phosphoglycerate mutase